MRAGAPARRGVEAWLREPPAPDSPRAPARPDGVAGSRPPGRRRDQWPDARIRSELEARFGTPVPTGEIVDRQSVPLRSVVFDLMSTAGSTASATRPTSSRRPAPRASTSPSTRPMSCPARAVLP